MKMKNVFLIIGAVALAIVVAACSKTAPPTNGTATATTEKKAEPTAEPTKSTSDTTAPDPAGVYSVTGEGLDGKSYSGELEIKKRGDVFQLSWNVGGAKYDGVGVLDGKTMAAAYTTGSDGTGCGAVVYKISNDKLSGKWGAWGVNQAGTENAVAQGELKGDTGKFDVTGKNPNGSDYKGTLTIDKSDSDVFQFSWDTGTKYVGTGIKMGDYIAAGSGSKQCGFVIYVVDGTTLKGRWGVPGSRQLSEETAKKK